MSALFNLHTLLEEYQSDIRRIQETIKSSRLPHISEFSINSEPFHDYPEFDSSSIRAILLYPTMPRLDGVQRFLEEGILVVPISYIDYLDDKQRSQLRWGPRKIAYQAIVRMFFSISEGIISRLVKTNPSIYLIALDEFGRVLVSKYIRYMREFNLNHTKISSSFDKKHLELILHELSLRTQSVRSSSDRSGDEQFELPELHKEFYITFED